MSNTVLFNLVSNAFWETLYMIGLSGSITVLIGIPIGILLYATRTGGIMQQPMLNKSVGFIVNVGRSIPFIILIVALIPLTRILVGTSIGPTAATVSLTIGAIPFYARIVENAVSEVHYGLIETGMSMGATPMQIITKILIPESLPSMINGFTVTLIALISYSAMAGAVGGGGLGSLAIRYGYQRFDTTMMLITIVILVVMVQLIQVAGDFAVKQVSRYR